MAIACPGQLGVPFASLMSIVVPRRSRALARVGRASLLSFSGVMVMGLGPCSQFWRGLACVVLSATADPSA